MMNGGDSFPTVTFSFENQIVTLTLKILNEQIEFLKNENQALVDAYLNLTNKITKNEY
jgi:hypothetical protein